ncbi:MAG: ABC transporter permease [Trueperaceae bacterium]
MLTYIGRRIALMIPSLFGVTVVVFGIMQMIPGDPAVYILGDQASEEAVQALRRRMGLDRPLLEQYVAWVIGILRGDFGVSYRDASPVLPVLLGRFPATLELMLASMVLALGLGIPVGVLSAVHRNSVIDTVSRVFALAGHATPTFWRALMLILLFAFYVPIFPPSGRNGLASIVLPAIALGSSMAGVIMRLTRSSVLEVLSDDYVRTARAKGLRERVVVYRHALRNALLPVATIIGIQVGNLLGGSVVTETVFAWPGIGRYAYLAMMQRDYTTVMGSLFLFSLIYMVINLLTDLSYGWLDPRVRYG